MKNYSLLFLAAIALAGCGDEDDSIPEASDTAAHLAGRFEADPPGSGPFVSVTLRGNGTFEAVENVVCAQLPCAMPRIEGRYKLTRAGEKRYLHLTADDGADLRWAWQKFGDELQIRKAGSTGWAVLGYVAVAAK